MTDDELDRYARAIDAGKLEHWTFRWPGLLLRILVRPLLFMALYAGLLAALYGWWGP